MTPLVWITGAAGFSGRHLARYLNQLPKRPRILGLGRHRAPRGDLDLFCRVDITAPALCDLARVYPPDAVFHLAGLLPSQSEEDLWRVNVGGTQNLLRALARNKKKGLRVISIGSAAEYLPSRRPLAESDSCNGETPYGQTKWAQTVMALACGSELGLDVIIARTFNLVGPGLSSSLLPGRLTAQFHSKRSARLKVGNLTPRRDFVDVRDAVTAYWLALEKGRAGEVYNVCSGQLTSMRTLVRLFSTMAPGRPGVAEDRRSGGKSSLQDVVGDNSKLRKLGWRPVISLRQSVSDMLDSASSR